MKDNEEFWPALVQQMHNGELNLGQAMDRCCKQGFSVITIARGQKYYPIPSTEIKTVIIEYDHITLEVIALSLTDPVGYPLLYCKQNKCG
jgi:hypothetical protein